jgi:hypothetical protein
MKRNGRSNVVLTKKAKSPEPRAEELEYFQLRNEARKSVGLKAMTWAEHQADCRRANPASERIDYATPPPYRPDLDESCPSPQETKDEAMAFHNACRAERGQSPLSEREYDEMMANVPKFDWAGLRERLLASGSTEDDELIQLCREHEAIDAGATKGVKQ